ncbi:MAG: amidohydrolase [Cyclobacteriaceae bacterium]
MKISVTILSALLLCSFNLTNTELKKSLDVFIGSEIDNLQAFYTSIHQNPEISLEEKETSKKLANELKKLGFEVTENFGGYGVVGIYKNGDGPQILYRTDMDALPVQEKTDLDYASTKMMVNPWNNNNESFTMHACGHDMHMTVWTGVAQAMVAMKDQWNGTLMLIGQPAEEIGQGSRMMLENGLYEKFGVPDFGLGMHSSPTIAAGKVGLGQGWSMAAVESVDINVYGFGAHGASPHMSVDPVVLASMIVMELQTIVSRNMKPIDDAVITVGSMHGGTKHNIIPDEVKLQLTIRTYTQEVRDLIHKRIKEICDGTAMAAGLPKDKWPKVTKLDQFTPANYNSPNLVTKIINSSKKAIGDANVEDAEPQMVGEDFSRFGQTEHNVPTVLMWLGTVPDSRMKAMRDEGYNLPALHSPFYYPDPRPSIETGVKVGTTALIDLFNSPN